jgi:hypothetical protein
MYNTLGGITGNLNLTGWFLSGTGQLSHGAHDLTDFQNGKDPLRDGIAFQYISIMFLAS